MSRCADTTVVIRGGTTTKSFLLDLLDRPEVVAGTADTGWLDRTGTGGGADPARHAALALVQVAIDVSDAEEARERAAFLASARGGRPRAAHDVGRTRGARLPRPGLPADRRQGRPRTGTACELDGRYVDVDVDRLSAAREPARRSAAERFSVVAVARGHARTWSRSTASPTGSPGTRRAWCARRHPRSSSPSGRPSAQDVEAGQTIVVLESMKMETAVRAPFAGRVREVLAVVNAQVDAGAAAAAASSRPATRSRRPSASGSTLPGVRRGPAGGRPRDGAGPARRDAAR